MVVYEGTNSYIYVILYKMLYITCPRRQDPRASTASGIAVAWPGHDSDHAQAPAPLLAWSTAGVVTCSRLIVSIKKTSLWALGAAGSAVSLLTTHAYPESHCGFAQDGRP
jgi:hypothetical protein